MKLIVVCWQSLFEAAVGIDRVLRIRDCSGDLRNRTS